MHSTSEARARADWYPDPSRAHQFRYFDGASWTDHVADYGIATQAPLGPVAPGLIAWFPPEVMRSSAPGWPTLIDSVPAYPRDAAAVEFSRATDLRVFSIGVAVLVAFPIGIFCGITGVILCNRAREAARMGDSANAARRLKWVRRLLITAIVCAVLWMIGFGVFMIRQGLPVNSDSSGADAAIVYGGWVC